MKFIIKKNCNLTNIFDSILSNKFEEYFTIYQSYTPIAVDNFFFSNLVVFQKSVLPFSTYIRLTF